MTINIFVPHGTEWKQIVTKPRKRSTAGKQATRQKHQRHYGMQWDQAQPA